MHSLRVVQLSDSHLFADKEGTLMGWPTRESYGAVVERIAEWRPEVVLFTGDVSQDGSAASYREAAERLEGIGAVRGFAPGNHDNRDVMTRVLEEHGFAREKVLEAGGWRFVLLDSLVPGAVHGHVSDLDLDRLADLLNRDRSTPVCLLLHHHPIPVGAAWLDEIGVQPPEQLQEIVCGNPAVRLVLCGHVHQAFDAAWGQARLLACPSTCFQFRPRSQSFALGHEQPGFRALELRPDGSFTTEVVRVPFQHQIPERSSGY